MCGVNMRVMVERPAIRSGAAVTWESWVTVLVLMVWMMWMMMVSMVLTGVVHMTGVVDTGCFWVHSLGDFD
jgi:predicted phage tail protein